MQAGLQQLCLLGFLYSELCYVGDSPTLGFTIMLTEAGHDPWLVEQ